ncbi:hypothetical protein BKA62DRAFT_672123 [Auriculariales sp. MPI-PUGE-AT-0066]|nr:hypothetical protein BKA62DRAFT_672123 [Auriculariales sp. MPI-PUGE-AT-0066]
MGSHIVTFEDSDAVIRYEPALDDTAGWLTRYQQLIPSVGPPGSLEGVGNSVRETSVANAALSFQFYGTSLTLFGKANASKYTVSMDGGGENEFIEANGVLAAFTSLQAGTHSVKLTVTSASAFQFDRAVFDSNIAAPQSNSTIRAGDAAWTYGTGSMWVDKTNTFPSDGRIQHMRVTYNGSDAASFSFSGQAVYLYGDTVSNHGSYSVAVDNQEWSYTGRSNNNIIHSLLFFRAGFDPKTQHTLTLTNNEGKFLDFEYAVVVSSNAGQSDSTPSGSSTSSAGDSNNGGPKTGGSAAPNLPSGTGSDASSSSNVGAIAGGVVGGFGIACFIVTICLLLMRRRRAKQRSSGGIRAYGIDPLRPFNGPQAGQYRSTNSPYSHSSAYSNPNPMMQYLGPASSVLSGSSAYDAQVVQEVPVQMHSQTPVRIYVPGPSPVATPVSRKDNQHIRDL